MEHGYRSILAAIMVLVLVTATPAGAIQECEPNPTQADNGCSGCTTTIVFNCTPGSDCSPCTYNMTASLVCPPITTNWAAGNTPLPCGDKFTYRFGSCGAGPAWGWVQCECIDCP